MIAEFDTGILQSLPVHLHLHVPEQVSGAVLDHDVCELANTVAQQSPAQPLLLQCVYAQEPLGPLSQLEPHQ